jgi:hypothetical protein
MNIKKLNEELEKLLESSNIIKQYSKELGKRLRAITSNAWGLHYKEGEYTGIELLTGTNKELNCLDFRFDTHYEKGYYLWCCGQTKEYPVTNYDIGFDPEQYGFTRVKDHYASNPEYYLYFKDEKDFPKYVDLACEIVTKYLPKVEEFLTNKFDELTKEYLEPTDDKVTDFESLYVTVNGKKYKCYSYNRVSEFLNKLTKFEISATPNKANTTLYQYTNEAKIDLLFRTLKDAQKYKDEEYDRAVAERRYPKNSSIDEIDLCLNKKETDILFTKFAGKRMHIEKMSNGVNYITASDKVGTTLHNRNGFMNYGVWIQA